MIKFFKVWKADAPIWFSLWIINCMGVVVLLAQGQRLLPLIVTIIQGTSLYLEKLHYEGLGHNFNKENK